MTDFEKFTVSKVRLIEVRLFMATSCHAHLWAPNFPII